MIPEIYLAAYTETLKLINLILEGTPIEQRKANSIIWFNITWPVFKGAFPKEVQEQVDGVMKGVK
jgi:hypothetical protein